MKPSGSSELTEQPPQRGSMTEAARGVESQELPCLALHTGIHRSKQWESGRLGIPDLHGHHLHETAQPVISPLQTHLH